MLFWLEKFQLYDYFRADIVLINDNIYYEKPATQEASQGIHP